MAVYYVYSGAAGSNNGSSWANAFTTLTTAFVTEVAGDTLYVAHDHAESTAATVTLTSSGTIANPTKVVCVNRAGSVPPVSADRRATATVTTTGNTSLNMTGFTHYDGIIFVAGSGGSSAGNITLPSVGVTSLRFDNCSLQIASTLATSRIRIGNLGAQGNSYVELNNTTVSFGAVQGFDIAGVLKWSRTPSAVLGTIPTTLFSPNSSVIGIGGGVECVGVDLSALGSGKTLVGAATNCCAQKYKFMDCKLDAAVTKATVPVAHASTDVDFVRSSASGNYSVYSHRASGSLIEETTIVRTGGASDGTTTISWKIVTTANCNYSMPFEGAPIAIWNDTTGSAKTATVECIAATLPTDQEIWVDLEYLGDASSPQGSFVNDGKADLLATAANQTSSSATWGGSTAAFKLAVTFTAQQKGWIYARVKCAKASSTFYVDPLITLT